VKPSLHLTSTQRRLVFVVLALVLLAIGFGLVRRSDVPSDRLISLNDLAVRVGNHEVTEIRVANDGGRVVTRSGEVFTFYAGRDSILKLLSSFGVSPAAIAAVTGTVARPAADHWPADPLWPGDCLRLAAHGRPRRKSDDVLRA